MSVHHPISDSESESDDYLPPGLQSDASSDSSPPSPCPVPDITSSVGDESTSAHSSKTPSLHEDEFTFDDPGDDTKEESSLTHSFLSLPANPKLTDVQGEITARPSSKKKKSPKRKRRKSGAGESPKKRKRKTKRAVKDDEEDEEEEGEEEERGKGKKGKSKGKSKPSNRRRNIKTFLREDQLDIETLAAQREEEERKKRLEEERKRRLEEQKIHKAKELPVISEKLQEPIEASSSSSSLPSFSTSTSLSALPLLTSIPIPQPVIFPPPTSDVCIVLDSSSDSEKDASKSARQEDNEVITISSDEEVTFVSDNSDAETDMDEGSSGMHTNDEVNVPNAQGRILVNVNHPPDEPDIYLPDMVAKVVKPHQVGGIRFLYDNLVESLARCRTSCGFGCILAHSMGLGKTLQCISFISIFKQHTMAHTVLCIVPINTLQNWMAEFDMWCPERTRNFTVFVLNDTHKTTASRARVIAEWQEKGGVLLMGYEIYRLLTRSKQMNVGRPKKRTSKSGKSSPQVIDLDEMEAAAEMAIDMKASLCNPGPDMVVCDEGHRIKNSHAGISQALKNIRTRRRVVLTGYPLQNNLQEYWCMVDFVRPNFLGTRHEFANLFERPISNGQCMDSTPYDVRLMRYRAHVLHSLLSGFVQRRGFSVLRCTLPPKGEHVVLVRLTSFQRGLYVKFMQCFKEAGAGGWCSANPLKAFSVGCKIWNHPDILCDVLNERESLSVDLDVDLDLPELQAKFKQRAGKRVTEEKGSKSGPSGSKAERPRCDDLCYQEKVQQIISFEWAREIMKNYTINKLMNGGKMIILFHILEESIRLGDKLLVFSQSLSTLTLIEKFLSQSSIPQPPNPPPLMPREWVRNKTYFRLDGSTAVSEREKMINQFNSPDNKHTWLFLLSTKAGCLGINLIGANRVVVMDASWNPCHDAQAVCRVYRYGQTKKCYVYRLVSDQTLEKKIYDRQISKKGMSDRVVDEMNPEMNLTKKEVESLLEFDETDMPYEDFSHLADGMEDIVLQSLVRKHSSVITKAPFTTESLLWDRKDQKLTRAEKRQAKKSYEEEKKLNLSYSRPSYAAFYPKSGSSLSNLPVPPAKAVQNQSYSTGPPYPYLNSLKQPLQRPVANVRPIQSTPVPRQPQSSLEVTQKRLQELKNAGVTLQRIIATTDIMLPGANTATTSTPVIRTGEAVTFIKTKKGIYLRTHEGKILAVRGPHLGSTNLSNSFQVALPEHGRLSMTTFGMPSIRETDGSGVGQQRSMTGDVPQSITGLGSTQLGQLLSRSVPPQQHSNPAPTSQPDKPESLFSGLLNTLSFPNSTSQPYSSPMMQSASSTASLLFNVPLNVSAPFAFSNTSTLTMATDTKMHPSVVDTSGSATPSATFTPVATSTPPPQSALQMPGPAINHGAHTLPSTPFPSSFGDGSWMNRSQGSSSLIEAAVNTNASTASRLTSSNQLSSSASVMEGPFYSQSSDTPASLPFGGAQNVQLPSSLPYPQMENRFSLPSNADMSQINDMSDLTNLAKFVDSSFPGMLPYTGSLNPDANLTSNDSPSSS